MIDIVMTWLTNTFFWEKSEAKINENFYNKLKTHLALLANIRISMFMLTRQMKVLRVYTPKSSNVMTHREPLYREYFSEDRDKSCRSKK